jgi:RNA polymerase sigma-70 factor (ECF subfamily)
MHAFTRYDADPPATMKQEQLSDLVEQVKNGDIAAFEQLFQTRYTQIRLFLVYMVVNDEVGTDLTQETFLKAWQSLPTLNDPDCFDSWLYSIARRLALNYLRRERLFFWLPWQERPIDLQKEANNRFEKDVEERLLLKQALSAVPPRYRACVILQVIHRMPQRQIAELLMIKKDSVSTFVHRGLMLLQQEYLRLEQE